MNYQVPFSMVIAVVVFAAGLILGYWHAVNVVEAFAPAPVKGCHCPSQNPFR